MKTKILPFTALILGLLQIVLVLFSWIITSVSPSTPIRSLLCSEGIRWFLGNFTSCMATPLCVWLLLGFISYGTFIYSGLCNALRLFFFGYPITYRQRYALLMVAVSVLVILVSIVLLAFIPHAVLLGVTGNLFPSAFSAGLIPMAAFSLMLLSVIYGLMVGYLTDINLMFKSLYVGLYMSAPFWPVYILAVQLYASIRYICCF